MIAIHRPRLAGVVCGLLGLLAAPALPSAGQCVTGELARIQADDGAAGDRFGAAVDVAGEVLVVGAVDDDDLGGSSGAAYVYRRVQGTSSGWALEVKLTASDGAAGDQFGYAVATRGDVVVVGAAGDDGLRGAVYVYRFQAGTGAWAEEAKLVADDRGPSDLFGSAVAIDGERIAVGAFGDEAYSGSVYVYRASTDAPNGWQLEAKLRAGDAAPVDLFGRSLALRGDRLVVGSFEDDDLGAGSGAAYVFAFDGDDWVQQAKLLASDGVYRDQFGWSVAAFGDAITVGARNHGASGAVYVFRSTVATPSGWEEQAKLTPDAAPADALFGQSVALAGGILVVGAAADAHGAALAGNAYVYRFDGCIWRGEGVLVSSDGADGDQFGYAVAIADDVVVAGADQAGGGTGAAYVFRGASDCNANAYLDICDVLAGNSTDANGDGVPDACQSDADQDGVSDAIDVCPVTPSPGGVDALGRPHADFDHDCDVDLADFSRFSLNFGAAPGA